MHLSLVLSILLACALAPRPRQPALLLPLPGLAPISGTEFARIHALRLVGRGRIAGSFVVANAGPDRLADALPAGFILINVPGQFCSPRQSPT